MVWINKINYFKNHCKFEKLTVIEGYPHLNPYYQSRSSGGQYQWQFCHFWMYKMLKWIDVNISVGIIILCRALHIPPGFPSGSTNLDCKANSCCRLMPEYMALVVGMCCTEVMDECNRGSFLILQKSFHEEVSFTEGIQQATVEKKKQQWPTASRNLADAFQIVLGKLVHWYHERQNRVMPVTSERLTWQIIWSRYLMTIQIFNGNPFCSA